MGTLERIQGQKVRSVKGVAWNEDWDGGGSHSVTSSPGLPRVREQRAFFDGAQHTPLPPGPSVQRVRLGLVGRGRSDCECGHVRPILWPLALSSSPHDLLVSKALCQTSLRPYTPLHMCMERWVGGWRKASLSGWPASTTATLGDVDSFRGRSERAPGLQLLEAEVQVP